MSRFVSFLAWICIFVSVYDFANSVQTRSIVNERPIIGILSQEVFDPTNYTLPPTKAYIAASYIKFVEGAGGRVVPILINQDENYLRKIFSGINGLLFPGGGVNFTIYNGTVNNATKGFVKSGLFLLNLAKEANEKGDFFPVWGTCLGFEFMLFAEAGTQDILTRCSANNQIDKLRFQKDALRSHLFGSARKTVVNTLAARPVTANFHHNCVTPENFEKYGLSNSYLLLSTSYDPVGNVTYVSAVEGKSYPFFAVQFHPEKNIYEWTTKENLPHTPEAIETAQYFAMFFVDQARKSSHSFATVAEEESNLIYNFNASYTGLGGSTFNQIYFFPF